MWTLCVLVLLAASAHAEERPMVASTKVAIGLAPLHPGVGLWVVRPKTWIGLEFSSLEWEWDRLDYYGDLTMDGPQKALSFNVQGSLSIQRVLSKGPLYRSCYLAFNHTSRQREQLFRVTGGGGSFEFGVGISFQPWEKAVISLRQGVSWGRIKSTEYESPWWDWQSATLDLESTSLRLEEPRLWAVIIF